MEPKGLYITKHVTIYFAKILIDTISQYTKHFEKLEIDQEIIDYIKSHEVKYILMGFPNQIPDVGLPIITILGDPPRKLTIKNLGEMCKNNHISAVVTHDECTVEPLREVILPYIPDIEILYYKYGLDFDYMKDYNLEKDIEVSNMGKLSAYKYRRETHMFLSSFSGIDYRFMREAPLTDDATYYERYGKILNRSLISLGGCQQEPNLCYYKDKLISTSFQKNLEICACKSALLTTEWGDREYLGFEDGFNCILFNNPREAVRKVEYYLKHREELTEITNNGYELVHRNHDIKRTIPELIDKIEKRYL